MGRAQSAGIRGATNIPLGGGPDVLRAIYGLAEENGQLKAVAGDGLVVYTAWDKEGKQTGGMVHISVPPARALSHRIMPTKRRFMLKKIFASPP